MLLLVRPGIFDRSPSFADAAETIKRAADDRRTTAASRETRVQFLQELIATLEQAAKRRIRQCNRLARTFLWPGSLQNGAGKPVLIGKITAIEPVFPDDMVVEGPLQFSGRCGEVGLI